MQIPARAEQRYAALVRAADRTVIGLDFDGTLSPIVEDPATAHIHPDAARVLVDLAPLVAGIAVVTGRPARQVLDLGGLEEVGDAVGETGRELSVFGQYGNERWSSTRRRIVGPRPPRGLAGLAGDLPRLLRRCGAADALVEDKGLALAVHTRRLPDAAEAFERVLPVLREAADSRGLTVEPGRQVIEVRAPGMDKGAAVDRIVGELDARGVLFAGDDLGDVKAFEAVGRYAEQGLATLLVASGSAEEDALVAMADVVVPGPEGVLALLSGLAEDIRRAR